MSMVAYDREAEVGSVYFRDMIIHATLGVENVH